MARTEHKLTLLDDSGITSVAVCACGRTFIGIGPERNGDARIEQAEHAYAAQENRLALTGNLGRPLKPVDREALRAKADPGERRSKKYYLGKQALAMHHRGHTSAAIGSALGIRAETIQTWLKDAAA